MWSILFDCIVFSRQCVSIEKSLNSPRSLKSRKEIVHEWCVVENESVLSTSIYKITEVTVNVIECKPFESCIDANNMFNGIRYGY